MLTGLWFISKMGWKFVFTLFFFNYNNRLSLCMHQPPFSSEAFMSFLLLKLFRVFWMSNNVPAVMWCAAVQCVQPPSSGGSALIIMLWLKRILLKSPWHCIFFFFVFFVLSFLIQIRNNYWLSQRVGGSVLMFHS